jgi:hypothetical protein
MEAATNRPTARLNTVEEVMERLRIGRSTAFELIGSTAPQRQGGSTSAGI